MDQLQTEARNPASANLDKLTSLEIVCLMNAEDATIASSIARHADAIARAIDVIATKLAAGGRLIYVGAGTSGRLGVLDATECPPTFNSPPGQVVGLIAGGPRAVTQAVEGAEDHPEFAVTDLQAIHLQSSDVVCGIATSGRTPYVLGAVEFAKRVGAVTIGVSCTNPSELGDIVDVPLSIPVGPEILSGSTRLKAGTATKLVLNMLTTGAMVRLGKTFGNLMVDLRATNVKLKARTNRIVRHLTGLDRAAAATLLDHCGGELKTALVAHLANVDPDEARHRLQDAGGQVGRVLSETKVDNAIDENLCIGIDGGGTKTTALLARCVDGVWSVIGRGDAGPSNLQTVGTRAFDALDDAVRAAFVAAGLTRRTVACACLGLAGADRPGERARLLDWATTVRLAGTIDITNDAELLLAAGTPSGWGVAVIAGTGSIAIAKNAAGQTIRAGGWGPLLGDEGSAYQLVIATLQAVARSADGRGPATALTERYLTKLGVASPQGLIPKIYGELDRPALAALASIAIETADAGDLAASEIVESMGARLAETAWSATHRAFGNEAAIPIALAGGLFTAFPTYRARFVAALSACGITPTPLTVVLEPAEGALRLAQRLMNTEKPT
jgi:N-acetylmuramic acid 6-phosphate etherase